MKIYLISQTQNSDYETVDSAVVVAPDEETARNIDPLTGKPITNWDDQPCWCNSPDNVVVRELGDAADDIPVGVILALERP